MVSQPCRSALYIPASNARALSKAATLDCDAIIFDLEDAVAPSAKEEAREILFAALAEIDYGARLRVVRINGLATAWGQADLQAIAQSAAVDALLVPKVGQPEELEAVAQLSPLPLWAMMETPLAMLNAQAIAAHPQLTAMVMGTNDLTKDLGARFRADRLPLMTGLGLCVLAAKAHGRLVLDGVYNAFRDEAGLAAECLQGREMGFDGKTLIHPAQLAAANAAFAPTPEDIDLARREIAAFEAAQAAGQGVAVLDGKIVESLHVTMAEKTLATARAIALRG